MEFGFPSLRCAAEGPITDAQQQWGREATNSLWARCPELPAVSSSLPGPLSPRGSFFFGFPASYLGLHLPCFWHALPATTTPVLGPSGGTMERNKGAGGSPTFWRPLFLWSKGASSPPLRGLGVCGSLYSGHPFLTPPACSRGFLLKCHPHWCPFLSL